MSNLRILYFSTKYCAPCRSMQPVIAAAQQFCSIQKVDAQENVSLTAQYGITSVPTFVIISNGQEVGRRVGAMTLIDFQDIVQKYS